ncbi:hypothetical protein THAOC_33763 [Thalassiosira oceanica]|uniref:Uncharacterized protein n=1 Tax=Thalassiosira oceanica TaxID=159749 RepID=K0RLC0_THAOC|nr:hypothetical protein THAOC_33763 [Thalassiosira oceanica]|mmetsp:Transcript_9010/g.19357  ORF Transcript_9010/g.19357 Transcript_9010/m.19357 type:complete len:251 (+) Transcript_9010:109-861(+)|eukprot:EJK47507.1 hypothetical protein THAOC_33763 [Thalassiosira oceanica]
MKSGRVSLVSLVSLSTRLSTSTWLVGRCFLLTVACYLPQHRALAPACRQRKHRHAERIHSLRSSEPGRSVGDVTGNLHGGKYQFYDQYIAGGSLAGREFAESLYSGPGCGGDDNVIESDDENADLSMWVQRLVDPNEQRDRPFVGTLSFDNDARIHRVTIKNDERSWEKFHAFVLPMEEDVSECFEICPTSGSLAPRGGTTNACDETKPYSDSANVSIKWKGDGNAGREIMFVVGTEAEVWRYHVETPTK